MAKQCQIKSQEPGAKKEGASRYRHDLAAGAELLMDDHVPRKSAASCDFAKPPVDISPLTRRQLEVLRCFVDTPHEAPIARRLGMSVKTVKCHLYNIQKKLRIPCRVELMKVALMTFHTSFRDGAYIGQMLMTEPSEND